MISGPVDWTDREFQPGDIFACYGTDLVSRVISIRTSSLIGPTSLRFGPSHVAIACPRWMPNHETCYWFESTTLSKRPCLEADKPVRGAQVHTIAGRLADYLDAGGRVDLYRLTAFWSLGRHDVNELRSMLGEFVADAESNKPPINYDTRGALLSGTRISRRLCAWRNQVDQLFCSELIDQCLQRLGRTCGYNSATVHPARLLRTLVTRGRYFLCESFKGGKS